MSSHGSGSNQPQVGHLVGVPVLVATALALMFLTWVTVAVRHIQLGEWNIYLAMLIAAIKASLVCAFFMHLRWDRRFNLIVLVASILFLGLFLWLAMDDTARTQETIIWEAAPFYSQ